MSGEGGQNGTYSSDNGFDEDLWLFLGMETWGIDGMIVLFGAFPYSFQRWILFFPVPQYPMQGSVSVITASDMYYMEG